VARELSKVHPVLSSELMVVNRKSNAGVPREQALRGLWERTGVEEVRALISTMIQSEKWGTSIGTVLQVYAETLRRKRRQAIEKKAATIPVKMLFPLILFILPALFAVVMGPAVIQIPKLFKMGQ
jgi:tight adherence protein C